MAGFTTTSKIFDKTSRGQVIRNLVSRNSKEFKAKTQERIKQGRPTGRNYRRKGSAQFRRSHRASARGQRPAIETGTLVNAIRDRKTGEYTARVDVGERSNPNSGTKASEYAEYLQERMDRPIMSDNDAKEAQAKLTREANTSVKGLL